MKHQKKIVFLIAIAALAVGCARLKGGPVSPTKDSHPTSAAELQALNLEALRGMMQNLEHEIAAMEALPPTPYPIYEELRATDLAGMKARLAMLTILRDHCLFSKEKLIEAGEHPERKKQVLEAWKQHKKRMRPLLDAADKKVNGLERKRIRLEFDLIEAALKRK